VSNEDSFAQELPKKKRCFCTVKKKRIIFCTRDCEMKDRGSDFLREKLIITEREREEKKSLMKKKQKNHHHHHHHQWNCEESNCKRFPIFWKLESSVFWRSFLSDAAAEEVGPTEIL